MEAQDIMTVDPSTVAPTDTILWAAEIMRDLGVGCVPVVSDPFAPVLLGLITDRDIAVRCSSHGHEPTCMVRDHMTPAPLETVRPNARVPEIVRRMAEAQVRRIPVIDDDGLLVGIIAQADLATVLGPQEPSVIEELLERISAPTATTA